MILALVFESPLLHFLGNDLLQCSDLFTILLKYESVDLFRYLILNFESDERCRLVVATTVVVSLLLKRRGR